MRFIIVPLVNLILLVRALLALPFRLLAARSRPEWVRFLLTESPPYWPARPRGLARFRKQEDTSAVRSLDTLSRQIDLLCGDPKVRGVVFELHELELSIAKRRVVASLIERLRAAGKKTVGYAVHASNEECQLLAMMDRVVLSPAGRMELVGYAASGLSLGDALARGGVRAHFIRRGPYKTAPELFTHNRLSDIQRETIERLLEERHSALVDWLARGRRVTEERARQWVDAGPFSARRALDAGLCDALAAKADLPLILDHPELQAPPPHVPGTDRPGAKKGEGPKLEPFLTYAKRRPWPLVQWRRWKRRPAVAVVQLHGAIASGSGGTLPVGPRVAGAEAITAALKAAAEDVRTQAIVLAISSPGGSALASELILDEVKRAAAKKPLIAYVERVAASGGYMAAVGAREIWADGHALLGSIGVFAGKFDVSPLLEKLGIGTEVLTRGAHAGIFSPTRGLTEPERGALEAEVEETYQAFLEIVAQARGRTREEIHARGEGRVFSGQAAKDAGLIDAVGGFDEACRRALALAGKTPDRYDVRPFREKRAGSPLAGLLRQLARSSVYALDLSLLAEQEPAREPVHGAWKGLLTAVRGA